MARASSSNTKFASVNLNKSYGKPVVSAPGSLSSGSATLGSSGRARASPHGGMLLLTRPVRPQQPGAPAQKGGKVIVPRPVNLPSLRREHAGNDPTIALVGGTGASGWQKTQQEEAPVVTILPESTGMGRLAPALSVGSTWGTAPSSMGQPVAGSLSGEQWPVPNQAAGTAVTSQAAGVRSGVYTPPRARSMQSPTPPPVGHGQVIPTVEKAVVLRGEDFPTLQAALPTPVAPTQNRQKELQQKQREKQQEIKDQQYKLQQLSEQHLLLKPDDVPQSQLGGPQLQPAQPLLPQARNELPFKSSKEDSQSLEQQGSTVPGLFDRPTTKPDGYSFGPPSPGLRVRRPSNWTDDERDPAPSFRPQGGPYPEWIDCPDREAELRHISCASEEYGDGRPPTHREVQPSFVLGRDALPSRDINGREARFGGDNSAGREAMNTGGSVRDSGFNRDSNIGREGGSNREGGFREWGGGFNRDTGYGGRGFSREGNRDFGSHRESYHERGGYVRPSSGGREGFNERQGFGNREGGFNRDFNFNRDGGFNRENSFGKDNRRSQGGEYEGGHGRFGDRFTGNGGGGRFDGREFKKPGGFSGGRGMSGPESGVDFGRDKRGYGGFHSESPYTRNFGEIHGLDSFRPAQGVGIEPPLIPLLGARRKKDEVKESDFRDAEREAFEAELERVQKSQELDRQRKLEERERAVEMAQKEIEDRERQAREEEERQAKLEEEAKEAAAKTEREALEAAQKIEDERKAREFEKRHLQLEEERRKENARRKLLELEERIAKREAEKKQQEETRQIEEGRSVPAWQSQEEEGVRLQEEAEREEEERLVASITATDQDDDDRAPLRPSRAVTSPVVSSRSLQDDIPTRAKSPEVQPPHRESGSRVPDFRGGNPPPESERRTFLLWRREHSTDNGNGSASSHTFPSYGRDENIDFQALMPRDRVFYNRGFGDRGDSFYSGGFPLDGGPGDFSRRPQYGERRWPVEEAGQSKHIGSNRATTPDYEGGLLESSGDRDDRRWVRDRTDRWRPTREGPVSRVSPPRTPPYFQGSDTMEPFPYGRLRQSLAKQPRVPPLPVTVTPQRPPVKLSDEQTSISAPQIGDDGVKDVFSQEMAMEKQPSFSGQEVAKDQPAESSTLPRKQEEATMQQSKTWGPPQREWQQFPSSSLRPQRSFAQVSQGPQPEEVKVIPSTSLQERDSPLLQEVVSPTIQMQSVEEREGTAMDASTVIAEGDKQESEGQVEDQDFDEENDDGQTDEEEDDDDQEGDEEGYEGYDEEDDEDDDDEEEGDEVDEEEGRDLAEQEIDRTEVSHEGGNEEGFTVVGYGERITEVGGELNEEDDEAEEMLLDEPVDNTEQSQKQETEGKRILQESSQQSNPSPTVIGSTGESDTYDARHPSPSPKSQQPLSFMAFSMPQANVIPISSSQLASVPLPGLQNPSEVPVTLQFGLLPGTSLLPGSVPAIQIGSIQMPLHVPSHIGLQQVTHMPSTQAPMFQFGQLGHQTPIPQTVSSFNQHSRAATASSPTQLAEAPPVNKDSSHEQQDAISEDSPMQGQLPGDETLSLQPKSPWMNQYASVEVNTSVEVETRETRFNVGKTGQRPERRLRERGAPREGLNSAAGQANYPRAKSVHKEPGTQRSFYEGASSQANELSYRGGGLGQGSFGEGTVVDPSPGGENLWQRQLGGRGRGSLSRGGGMLRRGHVRSGSTHSIRIISQSSIESTGTSTGAVAPYVGADGVVVRTRPGRRSNFRRTEFKGRDSQGSVERMPADPVGVKPHKQTANAFTDAMGTSVTTVDGRESSRDAILLNQERSYSGESSQRSGSRFDRSGSSEVLQKNGGRVSGSSGGLIRSGEGLLGKYSSETTPDAPLHSGVVQVFKQPGIEAPSDEDDFIEVRSKRQMLNDRREQREKEIKAKSKDMKAKEQAARKQRSSAKSGSQVEGFVGNGSKTPGAPERRPSSVTADSSNATTRLAQPGTPPPGNVSAIATASGTSQVLPLAPIGTPAGGLSDKRVKVSKSSQSNSASGGSLGDGEIGAVSATSESQSIPQEGMPGTSLAWGGSQSTRQVVSLTQIQLEEAMKPVRYEAPMPQQLPLKERGSMVLDPGTTVASIAGKDKLSSSATGPIGSLLAGDKIQFGAVTSPPLAMSNSRPHTPALISVVGSSLGSRVEGTSEENDLKKSKRIPGAELDMPSFPTEGKRTRGEEEMGGADAGMDAEAEAEAAASAVAVAAISSDESVGSTREPTISIRKTIIKSSFASVASTTNQGMGMSSTMPVHMQGPMMEDSMAAALPADLSVEPTSMSLRGPSGQGSSSLLSASGQSPFSGLEMSQMLGGQIFPFGPSKEVTGPQGSNEQGVQSVGPSGGGWQPQHSGVDSYYGGPPPSGYTGQFINPGAGIPPPHMLVYTNPFAPVGQFGQLGFMGPTYLPSGKQPDWKHTPVWSSGPGVVGMSGSDSLGGMMGGQRGSGNIQRMAPGPAVMPVAPPPGPFDLNLSAPFQIPNVDSSIQSQWSHGPAPMHNVPISGPLMGFAMQQSRRAPHLLENSGNFNLGPNSNQVNSGNFSSIDAAAQFPDELGLGDTSSSVPSTTSLYSQQRGSTRGPVSNQAAPMSSAAQGNTKLRSSRRSSRVTRGSNSMGSGNGSNSGPVNPNMGVNSGAYGGPGANGGRVPPNHMQPQAQLQQQGMGGMGQPHSQHAMGYSDQRGPAQQGSPRVGPANNWSGGQGHRKGGGTQGRPPIGDRGASGEKNFAPSSKLKQVYVAKPSASPRRTGGDTGTAMFNGGEVGQATLGL